MNNLQFVLKAINKAKPVDVILENEDELFPDNYICPVCRTVVGNAGWGRLNGNFCPECGQALQIPLL